MSANVETDRVVLNEKQLAELLGVSPGWVRKDRAAKRTIPFFRLGDCIRYDVPTVRKALLSRMEGGAK